MSQPARTPTDASPPPSRAADARLGAIVDSYSFDVERSHLLLQAGFIPALSLRKSRFCTPRIGPAPRRSACFWADAPAASSAPFFACAVSTRAKSLAAMPFGCKHEAESDDLEPEADVVARGAEHVSRSARR